MHGLTHLLLGLALASTVVPGLAVAAESPIARTPERAREQSRVESLAVAEGVGAAPGVAPAEADREAGSELTVYLMTIGPGDAIWEKFGHNAIWISDAASGTDVAYNYGIFSFDQPGFMGRFLRGDMYYSMEPQSGPASVRYYAATDRSVWMQELNLTPAQRLRLRDFLEWNALEENKFYLYDYYRDNCSTRVRDAIDYAVDGQLRAALEPRAVEPTYRSHSLRLTAGRPLEFTGLMLGLGPLADQPISAWEESFIPMELRDHVRDVTIAGAEGARVPLVVTEQTLFEATRPAPPSFAPDATLAYLAIGVALGVALLLLGRGATTSRGAAAAFTGLALTWCIVSGLFGSVLAMLWAFTNHFAAHRNENLFHVNPLALAVAALLPLALRHERFIRPAIALAAAIASLSILGFLLQALPGLDQVNGPIIALTLPAHVGLALGLWLRIARPSQPEDGPRIRRRSPRAAARASGT